jgi:flagellar biogenesis protein FliO
MTRALAALSLCAALVPAPAAAGPSLPVSIEDRGDRVAIFLSGVRTTAQRPEPRGDRLELPLDQPPPTFEMRLDDSTVRKVELRTNPPSVRVQLRHGSESTRLAAEMAELRQHGDSLEIILPREPREAARARRAAAALAAADATAAPAAGIIAPPSAAPRAPVPPAPAPTAASAPAAPAPADAVPADEPAAAPAPLAPSDALDLDRGRDRRSSDSSPLRTVLTFAAMAGLVAGGWLWMRRKRAGGSAANPLEILAQVSVGPRARVVWLSAGQREMLISVSEKDVRVLGQWQADGTRAQTIPPPVAGADDSAPAEPRNPRLPSARLRTNPSLSGLLRLRDQHAGVEGGENVELPATDSDDTEWARQLVAATRRGNLR